MTNIKTHQFHVVGMHCKSCFMLTENKLACHPDVQSVKAALNTCTVEVTGQFGEKGRECLMTELSELLLPHGYSLASEKPIAKNKWSEFKISLPLALAILAVFFLLQKLGIVNLVNASSLDYSTAFLVGIVASLSTCMAVVGGLLLSMSASYAREGHEVRPQAMFHLGRIAAFFVLGGVIGLIGSAFSLNSTLTFILGVLIGIVMLIMGLNLLNIFDWSKKLVPSMPKIFSPRILNSHAPFLIGSATFFLPCGFTQAMQIYTLSTGSFFAGGLTMLSFALGTLPVLALLSFGSFGIKNAAGRGVFFKTAGLVVIMFAVYNIYNSLAIIGLI